MQKLSRQQLIRDLITSRPIARQDELARLLSERGFSVTQASVSRDLDELGITKFHGRYTTRPINGNRGEYGFISIDTAGEDLIVIKCGSGMASAAAVRIDAARIPEIVGTIAGDDTIFVAVKDGDDQQKATQELRSLLEANQLNV